MLPVAPCLLMVASSSAPPSIVDRDTQQDGWHKCGGYMNPLWTQCLWNLSTKRWDILVCNWGPECPPCVICHAVSSFPPVMTRSPLLWCLSLLVVMALSTELGLSFFSWDCLPCPEWRLAGRKAGARFGRWEWSHGHYVLKLGVRAGAIAACMHWHWLPGTPCCRGPAGGLQRLTHRVISYNSSRPWAVCTCSSVSKDAGSFSRMETVRGRCMDHRIICLHGF